MSESTIFDPYLYVLIRNDLLSLDPGKGVAHGVHAGNQAIYQIRESFADNQVVQAQLKQWEQSTKLGFGTTISLSANLNEMNRVVTTAKAYSLAAGLTVDPTYPYIVNSEIARLIKHPEDAKPIYKSELEVICFREEITAAYVFGDKNQLRQFLGHLPLLTVKGDRYI